MQAAKSISATILHAKRLDMLQRQRLQQRRAIMLCTAARVPDADAHTLPLWWCSTQHPYALPSASQQSSHAYVGGVRALDGLTAHALLQVAGRTLPPLGPPCIAHRPGCNMASTADAAAAEAAARERACRDVCNAAGALCKAAHAVARAAQNSSASTHLPAPPAQQER